LAYTQVNMVNVIKYFTGHAHANIANDSKWEKRERDITRGRRDVNRYKYQDLDFKFEKCKKVS